MNWNYVVIAILVLVVSLLYDIKRVVGRIEKKLDK
jgi:hypothetical protein